MAFRPFYRRRFLNRRGHHAGAYVIADVQIDRWSLDDAERVEIVAELTISDCARVASLDFRVDKVSDLANALFKARTLTKVVTDFTAALEAAAKEVDLPRR